MKDKPKPIKIEMFYTLTCPNCKPLKRLLNEVLPEFGDKFEFKTTLANGPLGMIRTLKFRTTDLIYPRMNVFFC